MSASGTTERVAPGRVRTRVAIRLLVMAVLLLGVIGLAGHFLKLTLLASSLGPTAYVLLAHPHSVTARLRNGVIGHAAAVAWGLACLAVLGLWHHPSVVQQGHASLAQVAASALATGLTLATLEVLNAHHAPAAATALLITSGIAHPGPPLYGLLIGLAAVFAAGPMLTRLMPGRTETVRQHE